VNTEAKLPKKDIQEKIKVSLLGLLLILILNIEVVLLFSNYSNYK